MFFYHQVLFLVATVLSLALAVGAFLEAGPRGRAVVLIVFGFSIAVPKISPGIWPGTVGLVLRLALGIGSFLYLKARGKLPGL